MRTTVFLKGCPLHCHWCHNPESQSPSPELYFLGEKCTLCGACITACPKNCHSLSANRHDINRVLCSACGGCVSACPNMALEIKGMLMSVDEIMAEVEKDRDFYAESGGGMTVSGGEPMMQYEFTMALLRHSKKKGFNNCIETSGFAPTDKYMSIREHVDIFLFDFKESNPQRHRNYTGIDNRKILENLFMLDRNGAKLILRCPLIPGLNDSESNLDDIAKLAGKLKNIIEINIMPYHPMGKAKSGRIGKKQPYDSDRFTENETVETWLEFIGSRTDVPVKKG
ncbi:glycyl-radical enzyme activating protein [bacterium]|nr:glycyl-radical enzyme activating protein [candidate division CSSED10-310 bacterium]